MIFVTADTHGEVERFEDKQLKKIKKGDSLVILGDFGFVWDGSRNEKKALKWLSRRRYQLLFVDGSHENHALLAQYPQEEFCGGTARRLGKNQQ